MKTSLLSSAIAVAFGAMRALVPSANMSPGPRKPAPTGKTKGAGVKRAELRLAEHRRAQAERLKDAPPPEFTRQQRRQIERKEAKANRITPAEFGRRKMQVIRQSMR